MNRGYRDERHGVRDCNEERVGMGRESGDGDEDGEVAALRVSESVARPRSQSRTRTLPEHVEGQRSKAQS